MTPESFRNSPTLCQELKDIVDSRAFKLGVAAVLEQFVAVDAVIGAPEVASVRQLTKRSAFEAAFRELSALPDAPDTSAANTTLDDWGDPAAAAKLAGADLGEPYAGPQNPT